MKTHPSRRSFIKATASASGLLPFVLTSPSPSRTLPAPASLAGEAFWQMVRRQFSFGDDAVPMNAANLCPSPRVVAERVTHWTQDLDADCSFNNREKYKTMRENSRQKVAAQMGVSADEIALVRNTSEANNIINNGLELPPGSEIVLWDQNHPTNNVAWDVRAQHYQWTTHRVTTPPDPKNVEDLLQPFAEAIGPKTQVLAITQVSNVSGVRLPIRRLCDLAHARDIHVHVDGAQTWGALNVDLRGLDCDSYTASSHKWFVGPKEVGLLYVKKSRQETIWPNVVGSDWGIDTEPDVAGARRFESMGQRDDAALSAVSDTVDFHRSIGQQRIEDRVLELATYLKNGLKEAGFGLVTPLNPGMSGGVCIIEVPAENRNEVFNRMYEDHGIAGAPTGGFRLCPHIYNTKDHLDRALAGLRSLKQLIV